MWWLLVIGSVIGIVGIFVIRYNETKQKNKVKVKVEAKTAGTLAKVEYENSAPKRKVEMRNIDYPKLNKLISKGDLLYSKDIMDEASKIFVQALAIDPDHEVANNKLGLIYIKKDMPSKAEAIFRHLVDMYPKNAIYWSNLGLSLYSQNFVEEAKDCYKRALELDPKKESRYINLGQVYVDTGDIKNAVNTFSRAIEINPQNKEMYFYVVDLLVQIEKYEEGIAFMRAYQDANPYDDSAKQKIIELKRLKGDDPLSTA